MSVLCFIGTLKAGEHNFPFKFLIAGKSPVVGVHIMAVWFVRCKYFNCHSLISTSFNRKAFFCRSYFSMDPLTSLLALWVNSSDANIFGFLQNRFTPSSLQYAMENYGILASH